MLGAGIAMYGNAQRLQKVHLHVSRGIAPCVAEALRCVYESGYHAGLKIASYAAESLIVEYFV